MIVETRVADTKPQRELWEPGEVEWYVILRTHPPRRSRRSPNRFFVLQLPLFSEARVRSTTSMNARQALRALQYNFPQLSITSARALTQGRDNFVLEINHHLIFRFPRQEAVVPQLLREIKLMPLLGSHLSLPVPRFSYVWLGDQNTPSPFVGYPKLTGQRLDDPGLLPNVREKFLPPIAHFLSELHSIPLAEAIDCEARGGTVEFWVQLYRRRFEQIQTALFPFLPKPVQEKAKNLWESYLTRHVSLSFHPVLIHRDLWLHHLLCDPKQGTLTGVIDWGEAAIGDLVLDFIGFYMAWGREAVEELVHQASAGHDPTFWQRLDFYLEFYFQFYPPYTEALKAVQSGDQHARDQHLQHILSTLKN